MKNQKSASLRRAPRLKISILKKYTKPTPSPESIESALSKYVGTGGTRRVDIVFISDKDIKTLAGRYRNCPHPTDVLAFGYPEKNFAGEIAISIDTAKRQARERSIKLKTEVILLCIHGILHILGHDDENYNGWCLMRTKEFEAMMKIL